MAIIMILVHDQPSGGVEWCFMGVDHAPWGICHVYGLFGDVPGSEPRVRVRLEFEMGLCRAWWFDFIDGGIVWDDLEVTSGRHADIEAVVKNIIRRWLGTV